MFVMMVNGNRIRTYISFMSPEMSKVTGPGLAGSERGPNENGGYPLEMEADARNGAMKRSIDGGASEAIDEGVGGMKSRMKLIPAMLEAKVAAMIDGRPG